MVVNGTGAGGTYIGRGSTMKQNNLFYYSENYNEYNVFYITKF